MLHSDKKRAPGSSGGREAALTWIIALFFLVGLFGHAWPLSRELMAMLTPWVLLVGALLVVAPYWRETDAKGRLWVVVTYVVTYFLEVLGVATGRVFGPYEYGPTLGFHVFEVPLIIGFNWVLVILGFLRGAQLIEELLKRRRGIPHGGGRGQVGAPRGQDRAPSGLTGSAAVVIATAAAAVLFDYIMEPIAIRLDYWTWDAGSIPLQNYVAWFVIAFFAAAVFRLLRIRFASKLPFYYALIQTAFFLGLYLATGGVE